MLRKRTRQQHRAAVQAERQARDEAYARDQARRAELIPDIQKGLERRHAQQEKLGWQNTPLIHRRDRNGFLAIFNDRSIYAIALESAYGYPEGGDTARIWLAIDRTLYYHNGKGWYIPCSLKSLEIWMVESLFKELCPKKLDPRRLP